jgi:hypothetical protein
VATDSAEPASDSAHSSAEVVLFRVLGVHDDYLSARSDGAGDVVLTYADAPSPGDTTRVTLGSRPDFYVEAWRQSWAWMLAAFTRSGEWRPLEDPTVLRDQICDELAADATLPDGLQAECGLWVTVQVSRPCTVTVEGSGRYFWADFQELDGLSDEYRSDVQAHIDLVMAGIEAASGLRLEVPVVVNDRPLFFVEGRAPFAAPTITAGGATISTSHDWEQIPTAAIDGRLRDLQSLPHTVQRSVAHASRWSLLALNEDDGLRAFLFAFVGIEGLVRSLRGLALPLVVDRLGELSGGQLPVGDLMWPNPTGADERPNRSALFDFAVVISALSPQTADADTTSFKQFQRDRNRIAHGRDHDLGAFPAGECRVLLRRIMTMATCHEWETTSS